MSVKYKFKFDFNFEFKCNRETLVNGVAQLSEVLSCEQGDTIVCNKDGIISCCRLNYVKFLLMLHPPLDAIVLPIVVRSSA